MKLSMNFLFLSYTTIIIAQSMEGISLDFHRFKALNNNIEAWLFLHVHFYASSDLLMACRTMQLRFLKLGTVLTYAFKVSSAHYSNPNFVVTYFISDLPLCTL